MTNILNARILASLGMIVFVAALLAGGSGAFFSDTETSTGNTFTAGALDLLVDSQAHYAGLECIAGTWQDDPDIQEPTTRPDLLGDECQGTWTETNLGPSNVFFNLGDLKPGDMGENTISLHVENNDAYMCAAIHDVESDDNGLTEPEGEDGDATGSAGEGELDEELSFFVWRDDGDNIFQLDEEGGILVDVGEGPGDSITGVYPLFTPQTQAMTGDTTEYLGVAWCYGNFQRTGASLTCDGGPVTNVSQTDSLEASVSFYVEQSRNNGNFQCPDIDDFETEEPEIDWVETAQTGGDATEIATSTNSGNNALQLTTINDTASRVRYSYDIADINLSAFTDFSYDSKQVEAFDMVNGNASFRLVVDLDGDLGTPGDVKDVTYEPYYNITAHNPLNDASITPNAWQNWAATMADGKFWASGVTTAAGVSGGGGAYATNFTIAQLLAAYPSAKIIGISIGMGTFNVDQVVLVDNLVFNGVTLGFE